MKKSIFSLLTLLLGFSLFIFISCDKDGSEACEETLWYEDADGDGLGNPDVSLSSCIQPDGFVGDNSDPSDAGAASTPRSAFDEFNPNSVTISFDGDEITIESNGQPNHTSPYYEVDNPLYIEPVVAIRQTPGFIEEGSFAVTLPAAPELAGASSATGLGPIGISVTGVPIFNDTEGPNRPLEEQIAQTFDYAGAHNGPSGYHYHVESFDVPENDGVLSHDDNKLVGIMADGFLIYGRKEMDGSYPGDLDESGGHFGVTPHSDGIEIYHYHIINEFYLGNLVVLFGGDLQGTPSSIQ